MPLIFAEFGQTCRSVSMPLKRAMSEVSALIPLSGVAECAERPLYSTRTPWAASPPRPMMFFVLGCIIRAKSTPSKAPRSTMKTLPPPPSSAGVPMTCTSPPVSSRTEASASPAPTLDDVVPAGVPQAGQGVHLAEERHRRTPPPEGELRAEGGLHPGNTPLDAESFFLEEGGKRAAGAGLFQRELRVGGDFPKQVDGLGLEAGGGGENGFSSRIHFSFWSLKRGRILS